MFEPPSLDRDTLHTVSNIVPHGMALIDASGTIIAWNDAMVRLTGVPADEAVERPAWDIQVLLSPPDSRSAERKEYVRAVLRDILGGGEIPAGLQNRKQRIQRTDGTVSIYLQRVISMGIGGSRVTALTLQDVTEAHNSEAQFQTMYESASIGITRLTPDFRIQDANPFMCTMLGYEKGELNGKTLWDITHPADRGENRRLLELLRNGELESFELEKRYLCRDGSVRWGLVEVSLVRDNDGEPLFTLGHVVDTTERREAEGQIHRLSVGVQQSPVSIVITDTRGTIEYVNDKFCAISGFSREEAIGRSPSILKSGEQPAEYYRRLWTTIQAGGIWTGEFHNKRKDGSLYWEDATIGPITDTDGEITHFIAFKEDTTEKKELEAKLMQSQRLEAIGQLAGGIAHDFNNLLTVINGYSALVLEKLEKTDPVRVDIEEILAAGQRAGTLTQQLLAFSRKQVIKPDIIDLNELVADCSKMLGRLVGENIQVTTRLAPDLGSSRVDPVQMNQIIMNLAVNSRDAMPSGGRITIATENFDVDDEFSGRHMGAKPGPYCVLTVSDEGEGMDAETCARAFEPFFTTKGVGQGTGLGLSTVYGIVKQHNGYIWIYSEVGLGTTVKIYLPRTDGPGDPASRPAAGSGDIEGTETVLLVEDDDTVRGMTAGILSRAGYTVHQAPNGKQALHLFQKDPVMFDLLITDVIMPGMGGRELADRILSNRGDLRIIYLSGYTDETLSRAGVLKEDVELLSKPFHPSTLLARVRLVLDGAAGS